MMALPGAIASRLCVSWISSLKMKYFAWCLAAGLVSTCTPETLAPATTYAEMVGSTSCKFSSLNPIFPISNPTLRVAGVSGVLLLGDERKPPFPLRLLGVFSSSSSLSTMVCTMSCFFCCSVFVSHLPRETPAFAPRFSAFFAESRSSPSTDLRSMGNFSPPLKSCSMTGMRAFMLDRLMPCIPPLLISSARSRRQMANRSAFTTSLSVHVEASSLMVFPAMVVARVV
mmetsp:Transcript_18520/g.42853  ORF Transcript_18520/g.42853 Transcript_18520/m.42853 type:complete len:228 (-) Transcript_18520:139-822(-)